MSCLRQGVLLFVLVTMILIVTTMVGSGNAFAATNSGGPHHKTQITASYYNCGGTCENKDPYQYGCNSGAYVAASVSVNDASGHSLLSVENWYSPKCGTNWAVEYFYSASVQEFVYLLKPNGGGLLYCSPTDCSYYSGSAQPLWTNMTFAPTTKITACGKSQSRYNFNQIYGGCATA